MPLRTYRCDSCDYVFTLFESRDQEEIHYCPRCSKGIRCVKSETPDSALPEKKGSADEYRPPLL